MAGFVSGLLFIAALMAGLGVIVFTLVGRWDAILAALGSEPIPQRAHVVSRRVVQMRPRIRTYRAVPSRQQLRRAAA